MHVPAASTRTQPPSPSSPSLPLPQKINKHPEELSVVSVMPCVRKQVKGGVTVYSLPSFQVPIHRTFTNSAGSHDATLLAPLEPPVPATALRAHLL